MRFILMGAVVACAMAAPAYADDARSAISVTEFLAGCDRGDARCDEDLEDGFMAGAEGGFICPGDEVSGDDVVSQELAWIRNAAASNTQFENSDDAIVAAASALWPCGKQ